MSVKNYEEDYGAVLFGLIVVPPVVAGFMLACVYIICELIKDNGIEFSIDYGLVYGLCYIVSLVFCILSLSGSNSRGVSNEK